MKRAVVTGGTSGIGAGISSLLANEGWSVIAVSNSEQEIEAISPQNGIKFCFRCNRSKFC